MSFEVFSTISNLYSVSKIFGRQRKEDTSDGKARQKAQEVQTCCESAVIPPTIRA
jgi:hypothetical protein